MSTCHSSSSSSSSSRVAYRVDWDKAVIVGNFERRGWVETESDTDWNFFWSSVGTTRQIFNPETGFRLHDAQILNHYPNHYELTRKDLMAKNIKRYRKERGKEQQQQHVEFVPATYMLPGDYSLFVEEFKRTPGSVWIVKPAAKAQGHGIFLVNKLTQIRQWMSARSNPYTNGGGNRDMYVVSRYIDRPLLIGGKKFDLRMYVLVTNYRPLKCYLYCEGFARFCNAKYTNDVSDIDNHFVHLTNVAVQKHGDEYNASHGNKWNTANLRLYLQATRGQRATDKMFADIVSMIVHSLRAVQHIMVNDKHCFECYGYDILIDADLRPWLVEVNASPSLSATTQSDRAMKMKLINDIIEVVVPPDFPSTNTSRGTVCWNTAPTVGNFDLLYDESSSSSSSLSSSSLSSESMVTTAHGARSNMGTTTTPTTAATHDHHRHRPPSAAIHSSSSSSSSSSLLSSSRRPRTASHRWR